jgi:hypothetical protein
MDETLIKRLKPWISVFSAEINMHNQHGDNVKVGGKITSIFDISSFALELKEDDVEACITIDDSIGTTDLLFIRNTFKAFNDTYIFTPGMVILAEGKVLKEQGKKLIENPSQVSSIVCWDIKPLDKIEENL